MKLQFEIKCSTCGSGNMVLDTAENGATIVVCKNSECADFNCFADLYRDGFLDVDKAEIIEGLTGSEIFVDGDGRAWKETYENGRIIDCHRVGMPKIL
jgi:hypothetical protein